MQIFHLMAAWIFLVQKIGGLKEGTLHRIERIHRVAFVRDFFYVKRNHNKAVCLLKGPGSNSEAAKLKTENRLLKQQQ